MTVQELFNSLTFDDVMAALRNTHRNDESIKNVAGYKEAYDIICHLLPEGVGGEVRFEITAREEWFAPHSLPLIANNVEGDYWENSVRKTVVKPDDNPFTDAELAGAILWGMTFYGFTPYDKWSPINTVFSHYGEQAKLLERKLYIPYLRDKKERLKLKKGELSYGVAFSMEIWDEIHQRQKHQNRSKRRRYHRIEQRIELLQKLDKRQHLIDLLHDKIGCNATPSCEILKAESISETRFDSHCYGKLPRIDYLFDLLENYFPNLDKICQSGDHNIVVCYTTDTTPLVGDEKCRLHSFLSSHFSADSDWQLFFASDSAIPNEMALQFIGIKNYR